MYAKQNYERENSKWGLGLTFNLLAKIKTHKKPYAFKEVVNYYENAIQNFKDIEHWRGTYIT